MYVRLRRHECLPPAPRPHALPEGVAHSPAARPRRRGLRPRAGHRFSRPLEARHGLRDARADGGQGLHHVAPGGDASGSRRAAAAPLHTDAARAPGPRHLVGPGAISGAGGDPMTPGLDWLRDRVSLLVRPSTMERLVDPILTDVRLECQGARRSGHLWASRWRLVT